MEANAITRRGIIRGFGALAAVGPAARTIGARAQASPRVVIIGGGIGGTTVATYLKRTAPNVRVTLIERNQQLTTSLFSNLFLGGLRTLASITHSYEPLRAQGIDVVVDVAIDVDAARKIVTLMTGAKMSYDRLVLSPGIDMRLDSIDGYGFEAARTMPHAWRAGEQMTILKGQLEAMSDGGVVVISPPPDSYSGPAAPYERACMIAHFLKARKPRSKLVIVDPKRTFFLQPLFLDAFKKYYSGVVELHLTDDKDNFQLDNVNSTTSTITTKSGLRINAAVANIIPAQNAGGIAYRAGCVKDGWCPVVLENFASTEVKDVYVVGDASIAAEMPKSAFSANSQGKLVARHLASELGGKEIFPQRLRDTGWSVLAPDDSIRSGANYAIGVKDGAKRLVAADAFVSTPGEDARERLQNFVEAAGWYSGITRDMLGN
jgi:sulfide dehydrogenase [flavocytochrome c] flavoprotein chain